MERLEDPGRFRGLNISGNPTLHLSFVSRPAATTATRFDYSHHVPAVRGVVCKIAHAFHHLEAERSDEDDVIDVIGHGRPAIGQGAWVAL